MAPLRVARVLKRTVSGDTFNQTTNNYDRMVVWTNPNNEKDVLFAPQLASRWPIEKERDRVFDGLDVTVGADGHAERDFQKCWQVCA